MPQKNKETSVLKSFLGGIEPTGKFTIDQASKNTKNHTSKKNIATAGGAVGGFLTGTALTGGALMGGAALATRRNPQSLVGRSLSTSGKASLKTINPFYTAKTLKRTPKASSIIKENRDILRGVKDLKKDPNRVSEAGFKKARDLSEGFRDVVKREDNFFSRYKKSPVEQMEEGVGVISGIIGGGTAAGVGAVSARAQYNAGQKFGDENKKLSKKASISNKWKGLAWLAGGTTATSVTPKVVGYKDENEGGSFGARAGVVGSAAALSAAAFSPRKALPRKVIKKILSSGHKGAFKATEKYSPIVGAGWGAISGLSSYEAGRKVKSLKEDHMDKKAALKKLAGMIDPIQDSLPKDIFDENQKMHPHIRKYFIDKLSSVIDLNRVEKFVLIGSLTSHKYSDTSDVDLSVYIKNPPKEWEGSSKSELVGDISYETLPGTKRKYTYYVVPWTKGTEKGLQNRSFASYDLLNDTWYTPPIPREEYVSPDIQFRSELQVGRHHTKKLNRLIEKWKFNQRGYLSYKGSRHTSPTWSPIVNTYHKRKAQWALKDLTDFIREISRDRYWRYSQSWGIPRNAKENVFFKMIEYSGHYELVSKLAQVELPPKVEDINVEEPTNQPGQGGINE